MKSLTPLLNRFIFTLIIFCFGLNLTCNASEETLFDVDEADNKKPLSIKELERIKALEKLRREASGRAAEARQKAKKEREESDASEYSGKSWQDSERRMNWNGRVIYAE